MRDGCTAVGLKPTANVTCMVFARDVLDAFVGRDTFQGVSKRRSLLRILVKTSGESSTSDLP